MGTSFRTRWLHSFVVMVLLAAPFTATPPRSVNAAGPWYVAPGGNDGNTCDSAGSPCATLNGAIAKASAGDSILVAAGAYTGSGSQVVLVDKSLSISGGWDAGFAAQTGQSTIDAQGARRGLQVATGAVVSLDRFVIQNGFLTGLTSFGAGIWNRGSLTVSNSVLQDNIAYMLENVGNSCAKGGHIYNSGTLTVTASVLQRSSSCVSGDALANTGTALLEDSWVTEGVGNAAIDVEGPLTIRNSVLDDHWGTAIQATTAGSLQIINSTISHSGRGLHVGVSSSQAFVLTVTGSSFHHNRLGVSLWRTGAATLQAAFNNSTLSENIGSGQSDFEGGIYLNGATLALNNTTISDNSGPSGGLTRASGTVTLGNSVLGGNTSSQGNARDCAGTIGSGGYNLISSLSGCSFAATTGDVTGVDPLLGPLMGEPAYRPLAPTSPAIDTGNPAGCQGSAGLLSTDQRGAARSGICDKGAYEYLAPTAPATIETYSGTPQHAALNAAYPDLIQALVLDGAGSPVPGIDVTFQAPNAGPSMVLGPGGATAIVATSLFGLASPPQQTAGPLTGTYVVTAAANGVASPALFELGNIIWYVVLGGIDGDDCVTPATACGSIAGAMAKPGFLPGDTIWLGSGTYTGSGDSVLEITDDLTLVGGWNPAFTAQTGESILDGENARRVMEIQPATVVLDRLTFTRGPSVVGGTIYHTGAGHLTLLNSTVANNGAGIFNGYYATLVVSNTLFSENTNYAIQTDGPSTVALLDSVLINNSPVAVSATHVQSEIIIENTYLGDSSGRGIQTIGPLWIDASTITGFQDGGLHASGTSWISNSLITGNHGVIGAGIANAGTLTLTYSSVDQNTASSFGGGISNVGTLTIVGSSVVANTAGSDGGGLHNLGGTLVISNSTVSGNLANIGGGLYQSGGSSLFNSSTVADNEAVAGGGGLHNNTGTVTLRHTIVGANVQPTSPDCKGTFASGGYNLIGVTTGCTLTSTVSNLLGVQPGLLSLRGDPAYHPLGPASPAIDAGNPAAPGSGVAACPSEDQRGQARPTDGDFSGVATCDIGAIEKVDFSVFLPWLRR